MAWITNQQPSSSDCYLITAKKKNTFILYLAFFEYDTKKWYKYDPFLDNSPRIEIDGIIAWQEPPGVYIKN